MALGGGGGALVGASSGVQCSAQLRPTTASACCLPAPLVLPPCTALQYAAEKYGAAEVVDPRPYLVGSMLFTYKCAQRSAVLALQRLPRSWQAACVTPPLLGGTAPHARPRLASSCPEPCRKHAHLGKLIPAMGYYPEQAREGCPALQWPALGRQAAPPPALVPHTTACLDPLP